MLVEDERRCAAILIVGPTGAGKSPLGDFLEASGLNGLACFHFDFGEQLRKAADQGHPDLSNEDQQFLVNVLETGALLENHHFYIAEAILHEFVQTRINASDGILILNGLPRHVDQSEDVDRLVDIREVVQIECSPQTVCDRISANTGQDRGESADDSLEKIKNKLSIFYSRTLPLLDHYKSKGVPIRQVVSEDQTSPADMASQINFDLLVQGTI